MRIRHGNITVVIAARLYYRMSRPRLEFPKPEIMKSCVCVERFNFLYKWICYADAVTNTNASLDKEMDIF